MKDFEQDIKYPLCLLQGFTTSFADGDSEKLNTQIHFNTDSVFSVCNNSTTGQICNDICKLIPGSVHQTNNVWLQLMELVHAFKKEQSVFI